MACSEEIVMRAENLTFSYDGLNNIIEDLELSIRQGKITVLMGANGCGKSTLFHLLTKNLIPDQGRILLGEMDIEDMRRKEFAKQAAIVHQDNTVPADLTVNRLVGYGRTPYFHSFQTAGTREDEDIINWAMEVTDLRSIKNQRVSQLSGGQRQRVFIAMALAQKTKILFLDEPTTYLDIRYQIEIMKLVQRLNKEYGITVIMVLHDINQAMEYGDIFVGMKHGTIVAEGPPEEVIDCEILHELYGIRLPVVEVGGRKFVLPVESFASMELPEE